jgi:hypothetical protein
VTVWRLSDINWPTKISSIDTLLFPEELSVVRRRWPVVSGRS